MTATLTVAQIAAWRGLSLKAVYRYWEQGKLREATSGRPIRFLQSAVEAFFQCSFDGPAPAAALASLKAKASVRPEVDPVFLAEAAAAFAMPLKNEDLFFVMRGAAEMRDKEWLDLLRKHGIKLAAPPLEKTF
jgi:hypothetical protein